jgi:nucleotide-binding universal stress UspA family protein
LKKTEGVAVLPTRIVVGTDGSDTANEAVRQAIELARKLDASLHLVTAYRMPVTTAMAMGADAIAMTGINPAYEWHEASPKAARQLIEQAADVAVSQGVTAEVHVTEGNPADAIIGVAESVGADLIMVGDRGMTGVKRFLTGSVPNAVAHRSPCSVWIVDTCARVKRSSKDA